MEFFNIGETTRFISLGSIRLKEDKNGKVITPKNDYQIDFYFSKDYIYDKNTSTIIAEGICENERKPIANSNLGVEQIGSLLLTPDGYDNGYRKDKEYTQVLDFTILPDNSDGVFEKNLQRSLVNSVPVINGLISCNQKPGGGLKNKDLDYGYRLTVELIKKHINYGNIFR
jgi:hypothetical protein